MITSLPGRLRADDAAVPVRRRAALEPDVPSNCSATETIVAGEGLAVKRLALLFTDLKGSTALYDRIGDMKAFDLVRQHFGYLRDCIAGTRARS